MSVNRKVFKLNLWICQEHDSTGYMDWYVDVNKIVSFTIEPDLHFYDKAKGINLYVSGFAEPFTVRQEPKITDYLLIEFIKKSI